MFDRTLHVVLYWWVFDWLLRWKMTCVAMRVDLQGPERTQIPDSLQRECAMHYVWEPSIDHFGNEHHLE